MSIVRECPKCSGPMISLMSQDSRLCVDCLHKQPNKLKKDQEPLIKATR